MGMESSRFRALLAAGGVACLLPVAGGCAVRVPGAAVRAVANVTSTVSSAPVAEVLATCINEANVRTGPGMGYGISARLPLGASVTVACSSGEWLRLASPNAGGYVYQDLLRLQGTPKSC